MIRCAQVAEHLSLKVGAQVILLKNDPILGLANGSRGVVVSGHDIAAVWVAFFWRWPWL